MKPLTAQQVASIIDASLVEGDRDALICGGVCTDTRQLREGSLFVALSGENFDGNAFARQALERGATAVVVSSWEGGKPHKGAVILVENPLDALQKLASWWRSQLSLHVIGLTGSNGKTSTKDMTAAVLSQKFSTLATRGNLNNHIGLPLTVLSTCEDHQAAVYEMGMNHPGEIAPLAAIAKPQITIITNIGSSHIEFLGSRENIAREKASIASGLTENELLILPHDCDFLPLIRSLTKARIMTTGGSEDAIQATQIRENQGCMKFTLVIDQTHAEVTLPVAGRHMVANALLAAAAGHACGMDCASIARGLDQASLTSGRLRRFVSRGITVFDDTYNANPESMMAGLQTLAAQDVPDGGRRFAVLGRMGELGVHAAEGAQRVGICAAALPIHAITVGNEADLISRHAGENARHFSERETAAAWLSHELRAGDVVLFKGSRTAAMERVMKQIFPDD